MTKLIERDKFYASSEETNSFLRVYGQALDPYIKTLPDEEKIEWLLEFKKLIELLELCG